MKKAILQSFSAFCLLVGLMFSADAQIRTYARASILFDFNAANRSFPAGRYALDRSDDNAAVWLLTNAKNGKRIILPTITAASKNRDGKGKLLFRRYGNKYFLAGIETNDYKIDLRRSRAEREFIKELNNNRLAKNSASSAMPEIIVVGVSVN